MAPSASRWSRRRSRCRCLIDAPQIRSPLANRSTTRNNNSSTTYIQMDEQQLMEGNTGTDHTDTTRRSVHRRMDRWTMDRRHSHAAQQRRIHTTVGNDTSQPCHAIRRWGGARVRSTHGCAWQRWTARVDDPSLLLLLHWWAFRRRLVTSARCGGRCSLNDHVDTRDRNSERREEERGGIRSLTCRSFVCMHDR